jgi:hypothetical protein
VATDVAEALVVRLIDGTELSARGRHRCPGARTGTDAGPDEASAEQVWDLLRTAIARPGAGA